MQNLPEHNLPNRKKLTAPSYYYTYHYYFEWSSARFADAVDEFVACEQQMYFWSSLRRVKLNKSRKNRMLSQDNEFKDINFHTFAQGVRVTRNARARNLRMIVANWSVNSFDSRIKTWQEWRKRVVKEILTGSISHFSHRHRPLSQVTRILFSLCLF